MTTGDAGGPLSWLRVVDLTDLRGAMCARILADLGADVVRVERRAPAVGRRFPRARYRNANKRGLALDLGCQRAVGLGSTRCCATADVLVENVEPPSAAALGAAPRGGCPESIRSWLTSRSPISGSTGPRSGWRLEALPALAASGTLYASGLSRPPAVHRSGLPRPRLRFGVRRDRAVAAVLDAERRGDQPGPAGRHQRAGSGARGDHPMVDRVAFVHQDQPAALA